MEQLSLRWNDYQSQITDAFGSLRNEEQLVDVTLSCEGRKIKAHRMLLSACSPYFREVFKENPCQHPVIVFRNTKYADLEAIIDFIYNGEVSVDQDQFESFLGTAELLEVKGLSDGAEKDILEEEQEEEKLVSSSKKGHTKRGVHNQSPVDSIPRSSPYSKRRKTSKGGDNQSSSKVNQGVELPLVEPKVEEVDYVDVEDETHDALITGNEELDQCSESNSICQDPLGGEDAFTDVQAEDPQPEANIPLPVPGPGGDVAHSLVRLPGVQLRNCVVCTTNQKISRSHYWCPSCNCGVHPGCYSKLEHFWRPSGGGRKKRKHQVSDSESD